MGRKVANFFKLGDWNAICDFCGGKFKASELTEDWKGNMACVKDWEPRHPQDFVRGVRETMTPAWIRPRLLPTFLAVSVVGGTTTTGTGIAGEAIAGEAIPGGSGTVVGPNLDAVAGEAIAGVSTAA